jgi:predicted ATPase/DNA-binding CsgD family transcriptional regulator
VAKHNLPVRRTSFIRREQELHDLRAWLTTSRLLTIVGVGGGGKSRLAIELASGLVDRYRDGVWLVALAPLFDGALVAQYVASVLGLLEVPGRSSNEVLAAALRTRHLLLVLDNCEHLLAPCAMLAETLLEGCPNVHILATSRTVLGLEGETVWRVRSLATPDDTRPVGPNDLARSEAGRLFLERARASAPEFDVTEQNAEAIAHICRRLDGIPLALELAAARVRTLGVADLVARLDDRFRLLIGGQGRPPRQQTLRATFDWSYDLLTATERQVFARLSVFYGGFTLEAAEAVCSDQLADDAADPVPLDAVVGVLEQLVNKSLLIAEAGDDGSTRYRLLETLRRYGTERLESSGGADAIRMRHADYFCALLPRWWKPNWWGPDLANRVQHVERELDNLRAALHWLIAAGSIGPALALGYALGPFWLMTARVSEGRSHLTALVAELPHDAQPSAARAGVLAWFGGLTIHDGGFEVGQKALLESLSVARACADDLALCHSLTWLAISTKWFGRNSELARAYAEEGARVSRAAGYLGLEATALRVLAQIALDEGDLNQAWRLAERGLRVGREAEHPLSIAWALHALGLARFRQRKLTCARTLFEDSLHHGRGMVAAPIRVTTLACLAWVHLEQGNLDSASAWAVEALDMARGLQVSRAYLALPLEAIAQIAIAAEEPTRGLRLASAAAALRQGVGPYMATQQRQMDRWVRRARTRLGKSAAEGAWVGGQALTDEEAIAEAMSLLALTRVADSRQGERTVHGGGTLDQASAQLTPRQLEVARLIARGYSNRQIAQALVVAVPTAERHVANILRRLDFASRAQVAVWASKHDAFEPAPMPGSASTRAS